mgnify:CR=1 FL=1
MVVSDGKHRSDPSTAKKTIPSKCHSRHRRCDKFVEYHFDSFGADFIALLDKTRKQLLCSMCIQTNHIILLKGFRVPCRSALAVSFATEVFSFLKNLFPGPLRMRLNLRRFSLLHGTMRTEHVLDMIFCSLGRPP